MSIRAIKAIHNKHDRSHHITAVALLRALHHNMLNRLSRTVLNTRFQRFSVSASDLIKGESAVLWVNPVPTGNYSANEIEEGLPVSYEDISRALFRIKAGVKYTHCDYSHFLSEICDAKVYIKKDFMQFTGSFKERGGRNSLMLLTKDEKAKGVVTASAGNHALALAWHGNKLGIPVNCVMPTTAPLKKVDNCRKFGANVILHGNHIGDAKEYALKELSTLKYINGYDDPEIIAGAGTMGVEILEQVPDVDVIFVPVGGAGLIAGVSLAVKVLQPHVQVIGVEPHNVTSFAAALHAGEPVNGFKAGTLADGLAVPIVGPTSFQVARRCVDETCSVTEGQISVAMLRLIEMEKIIVEGGGSTGKPELPCDIF